MDTGKNEIYLVTGLNESYLSKADKYIESMNQNSNVRNIVITLDFEIPKNYQERYSRVRFVKLSSADVKSQNPNSCMQHGGFLSALNFVDPSDIVIYTDADIKVQRAFSNSELDTLCSFCHGDVGVGYNKDENDLLTDEAQNLKPKISLEELNKHYPGIYRLKTFNTGVIVATKKTYERLYELYNEHWESFSKMFNHYAKQQWLLSYLIQKHFSVKILSNLVHTHGHYPVELRVKRGAGYKFCIFSDIVVLNHAIPDEADVVTRELIRKLTRKVRSQSRRIKKLAVALIAVILIWLFLALKSFI